ncbi:MAG TPA: prepilin peptidase [Gemmatimonadales bacterium]|nr:prepilin peptidase [Gemmatimonadales bacterium]
MTLDAPNYGNDPILIVFAGLLGALIGSFLNVCILRWGAEPKQSVMRPPSRCPKCGRGLRWYENVPIVAWLALRGRCRGCREPISPQYPLIELATALLWAFMTWRYGFGLEALRGAAFFTVLLGIAMTDARAYIIPDEFSLGGLVLGVLFALAVGWQALGVAVLGAAVGFGLLWLVAVLGEWYFEQEAMGGGDIKMMAMVGAFLGWRGTLLTIFLGALIGSLIFVPLSLTGHKKLVPFGIFLALGAAATYLVGPAILDWYGGYVRSA